MPGFSKFVGLAFLAFALSGCAVRWKGVEGFNAAVTPVKYSSSPDTPADQKWPGDPYASGGTARGSGGTNTATNYGLGSDPNSLDPVNPRLDQPEKGVGQQAGEYHADHATGYGLTNSPVSQSTPSDAASIAAKSAP